MVVYIIAHIREVEDEIRKNHWLKIVILLSITTLMSDVIHNFSNIHWDNAFLKFQLTAYGLFLILFKPKRKQVTAINYFIIFIVCATSLFSLVKFFFAPNEVVDVYKKAQVMDVLAYGDHIRVSWMSVIACVVALYQFKSEDNTVVKRLLVIFTLFEIVFLHVLSAKTGLIMLYGTIATWILFTLLEKKDWKYLTLLPLLMALPLIAYFVVPSFKNRIDFVRYDFQNYSKGKYKEGLSDAVRYYSIRAGIDIIEESPIGGIGYSNLSYKVSQWYDKNQNKVALKDRFIPSSQYLIYWAAGGIIGILILLMHVGYPFFDRTLRRNKYFMMIFVPAILSFTFETHLEGHLSIYVYSFFVFWFYLIARGDENYNL